MTMRCTNVLQWRILIIVPYAYQPGPGFFLTCQHVIGQNYGYQCKTGRRYFTTNCRTYFTQIRFWNPWKSVAWSVGHMRLPHNILQKWVILHHIRVCKDKEVLRKIHSKPNESLGSWLQKTLFEMSNAVMECSYSKHSRTTFFLSYSQYVVVKSLPLMFVDTC